VLHRPPHRLLALVLLLSAADYALWNWSSAGGHGAAALASGIALTLLLIALVWLLALAAGRVLAVLARRMRDELEGARLPARVDGGRRRGARAGTRVAGGAPARAGEGRERGVRTAGAGADEAAPAAARSSKLAA
jgi:hypothetical protein